MRAWPATAVQWRAFEAELAIAVSSARALDEVLAWLTALPGVGSVELAPHLMKSNPPQRWIKVGGHATDGNAAVLNLRLSELPGGGLRLLELDRGQPLGAG